MYAEAASAGSLSAQFHQQQYARRRITCERVVNCSFTRSKAGKLGSLSKAGFQSTRQKRSWVRPICVAAASEDVSDSVPTDDNVADVIREEFVKPLAPLKLESPAGQFLMQTLVQNPHLFQAAAEQQLLQLENERNSQEQPCTSGTDHVLYKRIAQLKAEERKRAVQEVIYALVIQRFQKAGIKMVPKIATLLKDGGASWNMQEKDLKKIHSPEAFDMILEHMEMVLGGQAMLSRVEPQTVAQISKLRVGQIYATSVMYGYFLKRVDERYQLEKKMKIVPATIAEPGREYTSIEKRKVQVEGDLNEEVASSNLSVALKQNDLRSYVAKFDHDTLSRYATMRTHETVDLIERHAEALFGRPDLRVGPDGSVGLAKDDAIQIKFVSLRALVLEAAAFGSYLWEVESFVDMHYRVVPRS